MSNNRVEVRDGWLNDEVVARANAAWPEGGWLRYDNFLERKYTCRDWELIPDPLRAILGEMALLCPGTTGLVPDLSLWGAGLCEMRPGDFLSLHLDHDRHPHLGLTRRLNAIVFLGECEGGELELWDQPRLAPTVRVAPAAGRLVTFTSTDTSYHAVALVRGPGARRCLALYFYGWPQRTAEQARRPRALFVAAAGESPDPERERLRTERSR